MKRIGIDARLYTQTGVGTYIQNLLVNLSVTEYSLTIFSLEQDRDAIHKIQPTATIIPTRAKWHSLAEQTLFLRELMKADLDLMHFTYFSFPILYPRPFVLTMHDLTPLTHKTGKASTKSSLFYNLKHLAYTQVLKDGIYKSKAIITPTNQVKDEILEHFRISEKKIHVIYEGINESLVSIQNPTAPTIPIPPNFILRVGNYYPHKNVPRLLTAYKNAMTDLHLVSVGPNDHFAKQIRQDLEDCHPGSMEYYPGSKSRIHFYDNVSNNDLAYLYQHACVLIQPSLTEGFGLPLLEAAHFGIPILASDIPVFRELIGDHATYFDPNNEDAIQKAIELITSSNVPKLPTVPKRVLEKFSFKKMASETEKVYQTVIPQA